MPPSYLRYLHVSWLSVRTSRAWEKFVAAEGCHNFGVFRGTELQSFFEQPNTSETARFVLIHMRNRVKRLNMCFQTMTLKRFKQRFSFLTCNNSKFFSWITNLASFCSKVVGIFLAPVRLPRSSCTVLGAERCLTVNSARILPGNPRMFPRALSAKPKEIHSGYD